MYVQKESLKIKNLRLTKLLQAHKKRVMKIKEKENNAYIKIIIDNRKTS